MAIGDQYYFTIYEKISLHEDGGPFLSRNGSPKWLEHRTFSFFAVRDQKKVRFKVMGQ